MNSIIERIKNFFPQHMRREIKELYLSTVILNFGISMTQLFEPIYLYTIGYDLQHIILFFLIVYVLYFILMPLGAHFAKRFGYEHSIMMSTVIFILYYITFYNIAYYPMLFFVAPVLYALQKTFYWPAYHADFARFADSTEEGREVGGIDMAVLLASVCAPLVAGIILNFFGFAALFSLVSIVFIVSNIPMMTTKEMFVPTPFPYWQAYRSLFSREDLHRFIGYLGYGEELIVLVVWPVFMAIVVGDLLNIGSIVALSTLITIIVTMYIGRLSDTRGKHRMLRLGSVIYSLVWLIRTLVQNAWGVLFVDTLSRLSKETVSVPLVSLTYDRAKQRNVMHTVVFFEMSLVLGKMVALIAVFLLLFLISPAYVYQTIFVLAGLMSLLYMIV